jgi:parvulin-like peptidyl-prolyl isomerase
VLWQVNQQIDQILEENNGISPEQIDGARKFLMLQQIARLVDTKLIYAEFVQNVPAENQKNIDDKLREPFEERELPLLMKRLEAENFSQFEAKLHELGSSLDDLRRMFKEKTIAGEWLRSKIEYNEEITHDDMLQYYNEHRADYEFPRQARWEELAVRKNGFDQPGQAYAALASMGNEIYKNAALPGPIFTEIAKARSHGFTAKQGGQHDWTTEGALRATALNDALFTLQIGHLSKILESETSFHIVRVLERKEAGRTPFTEVQNEIRERIKEQRFNAAVESYLSKLRKRAKIWTVYTGEISYEQLMLSVGPPSG